MNYTLASCDLRDLGSLKNRLVDCSKEAPTLIFTECVLAYLEPEETAMLLKFLVERFENFQFLDYEMFNGQDRFGKMMVYNFKERGCPIIVIFLFFLKEIYLYIYLSLLK